VGGKEHWEGPWIRARSSISVSSKDHGGYGARWRMQDAIKEDRGNRARYVNTDIKRRDGTRAVQWMHLKGMGLRFVHSWIFHENPQRPLGQVGWRSHTETNPGKEECTKPVETEARCVNTDIKRRGRTREVWQAPVGWRELFTLWVFRKVLNWPGRANYTENGVEIKPAKGSPRGISWTCRRESWPGHDGRSWMSRDTEV